MGSECFECCVPSVTYRIMTAHNHLRLEAIIYEFPWQLLAFSCQPWQPNARRCNTVGHIQMQISELALSAQCFEELNKERLLMQVLLLNACWPSALTHTSTRVSMAEHPLQTPSLQCALVAFRRAFAARAHSRHTRREGKKLASKAG